MKWFEDFRKEMTAVFVQAETIVARFPQPFDTAGQRYLEQFTVLKEASSKNYICYLLPFWLSDATGLEPALNKKLALGSVFGMLYYFIMDDLIDSPNPECRQKLPLGHLFHYEFLSIFRELFPAPDCPIWNCYRVYDAQWAEAMIREKDSVYMRDVPLTLAHKAAPVKLTGMGALLLANHADLREEMERQVDQILVLLQLVDDWSDWQEDLLEGSYNALVALAAESLGPDPSVPSPDIIRKLIYDRGLLDRYVQMAEKLLQDQPQSRQRLTLPYMQAFGKFLLNGLSQEAAKIRKEKQLLESGGLFYYLSKNLQNS
ncbi:hypothetical protein SAMN02799630_01054 [Paenibacillus sp. UNCCL117]|uniref:hypothetical protein n=1 Tax=unclassified Paenibacillus TaxID=185978 RepID=UPI000888A96A|nr:MULTISPECIES: hypothetical protein [unclassified Paenibacillus]SDC64041.1 hypothetical protein SAMN04488602_10331 [Paenibacillus sp. cl123]SFW22438.1 hypothetical protein SAMN02799630_01054 [Paenibacillus sp. UNCCL117]